MAEDNRRNLQYFEGSSMEKLFSAMDSWQAENRKRFLSMSIQRDGDSFCCIALTDTIPAEVIVVDGYFAHGVEVRDRALKTWHG